MQRTRAEELEEQVQQAAAHVHAAMARLASAAVDFESEGVSFEWGYSSCAGWLSVAAGLDPHAARELLRVGAALRGLPRLAAAFASGELSLDKLRWITRVASQADEQVWLEIGRVSSGAQLIRICRAFHRALSPDEAKQLEAKRGVDFAQRLDGLVTITARLLPEEAEIVSAAIEKVQHEEEPPEGRDWDDRDADAFVEAFQRTLSSTDEGQPAPVRVVIHVDVAAGACHGRFRLPLEAARELGCGDGEVQTQTEHDGVPIDLGRSRRLASPQLARAVRARDGGCVYPGCGRMKVHLHHLEHWMHGGTTNLRNLVGLCSFHHHQLHRGCFQILGAPGRLRFESRGGSPIGTPLRPARGRPPAPTATPMPLNYEPRLHFGYSSMLIQDAVAFANQTNGPPAPSG